MDYYDALNAIARPIKASALPHTLDPMIALMRALGDPHRKTSVVLVAGSVGKTTAAHELAWSLHAQGYARVGLYTSPHLHLFRERFRLYEVADTPAIITQAQFAELASEVVAAADGLNILPGGHRYSTFELATAIAYLWYAREQADIAVMEIGIGGRFDAVNVVNADGGTVRLAVITPIEMEHAAMLGGTLESIAWHKAGIIPQGGVVLSSIQSFEVIKIISHEALKQQAILQERLDRAEIHPLLKPGGRNDAVELGDGRYIWVNGAHTIGSLRLVMYLLKDGVVRRSEQLSLVIGLLQDKVAQLQRDSELPTEDINVIFTTAPSARGVPAAELAKYFDHERAKSVTIEPNLNAAFERARAAALAGDHVLITGSLRMAAAAREYFGLLSPEELDEAQRTRAIFDGEDYQRRAEGQAE